MARAPSSTSSTTMFARASPDSSAVAALSIELLAITRARRSASLCAAVFSLLSPPPLVRCFLATRSACCSRDMRMESFASFPLRASPLFALLPLAWEFFPSFAQVRVNVFLISS